MCGSTIRKGDFSPEEDFPQYSPQMNGFVCSDCGKQLQAPRSGFEIKKIIEVRDRGGFYSG
jgi:hypothetical protein